MLIDHKVPKKSKSPGVAAPKGITPTYMVTEEKK